MPVPEQIFLKKRYRYQYKKNLVPEKRTGTGKTLDIVTLCHVTMLLVTITMLNLKLSQTLPPGLDPLHVHGSLALEVLEHPAHQDQQGALYFKIS